MGRCAKGFGAGRGRWPMKVVHVLTRLLRAGSEENTIATCIGQVREGHEVWLVHGDDFDPRYYERDLHGVRLVRVGSLRHPISPVWDGRALLDLARIFRKLKADVVHTHQSKAGILGRLAAYFAGVPLIIHGVHIVPFANVGTRQRFVYLILERLAALITHAFIDVSRGMRDLYVGAKVGRPDQHYIVHSGFDLSRFQDASVPDDWRAVLEVDPSEEKPPIILMLAALEARKRHCEFLDAAQTIVNQHPKVRILMLGEGPHRPAVEERVRKLGLENNVKLLGYRTDPERFIALADVCVLTSCREGLPRVIMQYLAGGKPTVACDLPGLDEVLSHGINGLVVPSDDVAQAALVASHLLACPDEMSRLSRAALATDLSSWKIETMCSRISSIYSHYFS